MRIARELIDPDADKVVRRLARHGFQAYLVGGCVRDLLLARTPKDFDVATNATPKEIRQLFRNCRVIGRRFRLAHIFFGPKIIETSTFRANPREGDEVEEGDEILIRRDNVFGTEAEDARRRDFTINGLFYDVEAERVIDHVGGLEDLERRVVSTIGDPDIRFREDPVRMLRAVKFAARLGFEIEAATLAALVRHRGEIAKCPQPRVLEELYRLLRGGAARRSLALLIETGIATILSPQLAAMFGPPPPMPHPAEPPPPAPLLQELLAAPPARSEIRAGSRPAARASRALVGEEAAWAAVWEEDEVAAAPAPGDDAWPGAAAADPALAHDHEIEDVHDPAEQADFQAELDELGHHPVDVAAEPYPAGSEAAGADDLDGDDPDDLGEPGADDLDGDDADDLGEPGADDLDDDPDDLDGQPDFDDEPPTRDLGEAPGPSGDDADFDDEPPTRELDQPLARRADDGDDEVTSPVEAFDASLAEGEDDEDEDDEDDEEDDDDDELDEAAFDDLGDRRDDGGPAFHGPALEVSFGPSDEAMAQRRLMAWSMLDQLDLAFRRGGELSNSLLLAALCTPFVFEELLGGDVRPLESHDVALEVLHPLVLQLQIARRDAERCRQIMLAQRRLAPARRRRGKPMSLVRREFFRDALVVHQMMGHVSGFDVSDLSYWSKLHAQGDAGPSSSGSGGPGRQAAQDGDDGKSGKKRRRRRGGRRRRRTPNGQQGGDWEPVVGG